MRRHRQQPPFIHLIGSGWQLLSGWSRRAGTPCDAAAQHGVAADSPPSHSLGPLAALARLAAERPTVRRGGKAMKWRRVVPPIVFAILVSIVGGRLPFDLDRFFWWPARAV